MSGPDTMELTLAVLPEGLVIALEYPPQHGLNRIAVVGDYHGLPSEPGVYRLEASPMGPDFLVHWHEEVKMEPTGNFVYPAAAVYKLTSRERVAHD